MGDYEAIVPDALAIFVAGCAAGWTLRGMCQSVGRALEQIRLTNRWKAEHNPASWPEHRVNPMLDDYPLKGSKNPYKGGSDG